MLEMTQPPYKQYSEALDALRRGARERTSFGYLAAHTQERGHHDVNERERERLTHMLLLFGVASDVALIRFLLDAEICARARDSFQGAGDSLSILSMLLVEFGDGDPADLLRFWQAKSANFDTAAGGYDIEFVFCQHPVPQVLEILEAHDPQARAQLEARYDPQDIVEDLERWRAALPRHYPRDPAQLEPHFAESWAETFGDTEGQLRFGLGNATTPKDRAYLYRRLERHADALQAWREVAETAASDWDRASALNSAIEAAALAGIESITEVRTLDTLRHKVPNWGGLGIGRMSTHACFSLAAAARTPEIGEELWARARSWQADLESFTLVGLQAALEAADLWGSPQDREALQAAYDQEHQRIYGEE
jgi:hypothetical protein